LGRSAIGKLRPLPEARASGEFDILDATFYVMDDARHSDHRHFNNVFLHQFCDCYRIKKGKW
jgi:hypothetical protein